MICVRAVFVLLAFTLLAGCEPTPTQHAQLQKLSARDVIRMVEARVPEEAIIAAIARSSPDAPALRADDLMLLTQAKVPDRIIGAYIQLWLPAGGFAPQLHPEFVISSSAPAYKLGTPINIALSLELPAQGVGVSFASVCTLSVATVSIKYVRRDGVSLQPTHGVSDFIADPLLLQYEFIQTIVSGEKISIPWPIASDKNGNPVLMDVSMKGDRSEVIRNPITNAVRVVEIPAFDTRSYRLDLPGVYTVQLEYHYTGIFGIAFADPLDSNILTFTIN